jgi:putative transposase
MDATPTSKYSWPMIRKHPAHGLIEIPNQPLIVMVTISTESRHPWLTTDTCHDLLRRVWQEATNWRVGYYLLMPEHAHFFASPGLLDFSLERWMQYCKSQFRKGHHEPGERFQTDHWDTRIRSAEHYTERWEYIRNNPVRRKLVQHPDEWPYQGIIHDLIWYQN